MGDLGWENSFKGWVLLLLFGFCGFDTGSLSEGLLFRTTTVVVAELVPADNKIANLSWYFAIIYMNTLFPIYAISASFMFPLVESHIIGS